MRVSLLFFIHTHLFSYDFGLGYEVNENITAGGYISTKYKNTNEKEELELDDIAFLLYGDINDRFSFLLELESAGTYIHYLNNGKTEENLDFQIERAYLQYLHNEYLTVRLGKFISPVGLWNLIPIVVFRETSQKPRVTTELFPKFTTGVDISVKTNDIKWNFILQNNDDFDKEYNNFHVKEHYAAKVSYNLNQIIYGANIGWFRDDYLGLDSSYYGLHFKYISSKYNIHSEGYKASLKYDTTNNINGFPSRSFSKQGVFLQSTYKYSYKIHATHRYEIFNDEMENLIFSRDKNKFEHINLFGINYRLMHNMSLKMEYQISSFKKNDDIGVVSFSVLF